jgi:hypothetical protein
VPVGDADEWRRQGTVPTCVPRIGTPTGKSQATLLTWKDCRRFERSRNGKCQAQPIEPGKIRP